MMITTKDLSDAIKAAGWKVAQGASFCWFGEDRVIVRQSSNYGHSAFELRIKDEEIVYFKVLSPSLGNLVGPVGGNN